MCCDGDSNAICDLRDRLLTGVHVPATRNYQGWQPIIAPGWAVASLEATMEKGV